MNLQKALPPEAHSWAAGIHVNPSLTTVDRVAFACFFGFVLLFVTFLALTALNSYLRQRRGWKCFWCDKHWIGQGCGCISGRSFKVGGEKSAGSEAWQELDLDERLLHRARFAHVKMLEARRKGLNRQKWDWWLKRDAYLAALRDYMECRKRGVYR